MSTVCQEAIDILRETISYNNLIKSTYFSFCFPKFRNSAFTVLNDFGLNDFTLAKKGTKLTHDEETSQLPLSNKYSNLALDANVDKQTEDQSPTDGAENASCSSKLELTHSILRLRKNGSF